MLKIGDRVKQKRTNGTRIGTVIGIWEKDEYLTDNSGNRVLFAIKGEIKVNFDYQDSRTIYHTFSEVELEKIN